MFVSKKLKNISNVKHCFFSRKNGVSKGIYKSLNCGLGSRDDKYKIIQNIKIVKKKLKFEKKKIITLNQVHSNKVIYINNNNYLKNKIRGDAIITKLPNIGIGILTADCVPILFYDPKKRIIGGAHAGWKGALNGIVENTVNKFVKLNCQLKNLVVAVGPCIGNQSYEVGHDFYKKFLIKSKENKKFFIFLNNKKYLFNIRSFVNHKLISLGITNIDHIKKDTFSDKKNFFSYRRSIKNKVRDYGRCISVILMT